MEYEYKVSASGRVNLIGEHVDYCGGKVLPAALSLKNNVWIRANGTDILHLDWKRIDRHFTINVNDLDKYRDLKHGNYVIGSLYEWQKAGHKVIGADLLFDCEVPFGSGLSSSAAIEVSTIAAMAALTGEKMDKPHIAVLAQSAERDYVGVNCGIMDQYASACGVKDNAMLLDCATLACDYIPINVKGYSVVIFNCNKPHDLVTSKYNERRKETEEALEIAKSKLPSLTCLAKLDKEWLISNEKLFSPAVFKRARHVVEECERVSLACEALKAGNAAALGKLLNASHESLRDLYEVTGKELDSLWECAVESPFCAGSRMTGAGFGGCTVSLVKTENIKEFTEGVIKGYTEKIGYAPTYYPASIDDGITVEKLI